MYVEHYILRICSDDLRYVQRATWTSRKQVVEVDVSGYVFNGHTTNIEIWMKTHLPEGQILTFPPKCGAVFMSRSRRFHALVTPETQTRMRKTEQQ